VCRLLIRYACLAAAVLLLNFALPRLLPGDPLDLEASDGLNAAVAPLTTAQRLQLREQYRLDRPLAEQFVQYLSDLARGDLGWSISRAAPVGALVAQRLPWTVGLVLAATLVSALGGTALGLLAAWRGGQLERLVVGAAAGLAALPEFLVAMALLLALSVGTGWFPLQGARTAFAAQPPGLLGWLETALDLSWHAALPAATLALTATAPFVLLTHGAVRQVLLEPYLTTARAMGLSGARVAWRHALPNALPPVLTLFGLRLGHVLGGAIVVERVFALPGLGLLGFEALRARDYPVMQAVFLLASMAVLLANLAADLVARRFVPGPA
jgi:peptide/nickel transport system permease protein